MGLAYIGRVPVALLAVVVLLGPLIPIAWAETESSSRTSSPPPGAQRSEVPWFDRSVAETLFAEAIVLLVSALGCGLLLVGIEAFDRWRGRRAERAAPLNTRIATALQRDRHLK